MHGPEHIGEVCPDCGTHHRVIEALPSRPLTRETIASLEASDGIVYAQGVLWLPPDAAGIDADADVTEDIVLATPDTVLFLVLYEPGWVVDQEFNPGDDETAAELADDLWFLEAIGYLGVMDELLNEN